MRALTAHFLGRGERRLTLTDEALLAFQRYRWPGNVRELINVVEQLLWLAPTGDVGIEHLPPSMRSRTGLIAPVDDRRRQAADDLYDALVTHGASFWEHVYPMFLARDITRHDLRQLVRRGLRESKGRYKALLELFGISTRDYRRFMNFLAAHDCVVGFREFRGPEASSGTPSQSLPGRRRSESAGGTDTSIVPPSAGRPLDTSPVHLY